jgi:hypothetical protein
MFGSSMFGSSMFGSSMFTSLMGSARPAPVSPNRTAATTDSRQPWQT